MIYEQPHNTIMFGDLIANGIDVGLNSYPIFDESYRETLNSTIINYYYTREIGFLSPNIFIQKFRSRLILLMMKYNKMYEIRTIDFNPLYNVHMEEEYSHEVRSDSNTNSNSSVESSSEGKTTSNIENNNNTKVMTSAYPTKAMTEKELTNFEYINGMNQTLNNSNSDSRDKSLNNSNSNSSSEDNSNSNMVERYTRVSNGSSAGLPFGKALEQYKDYADLYYQLDLAICEELRDLFFSVYS